MLSDLYIILFSLLVWKCSLIAVFHYFSASHGYLVGCFPVFKHVWDFCFAAYFKNNMFWDFWLADTFTLCLILLSLVGCLPFFKHVLRFLIGWLFCYTFDAVLWLAACHFLNVFWDLWLAALYRRGDLTPVAAWLGPRPVSLSCPPTPTRPTDRTGSGGQSPPPVSGRLRQVLVASLFMSQHGQAPLPIILCSHR